MEIQVKGIGEVVSAMLLASDRTVTATSNAVRTASFMVSRRLKERLTGVKGSGGFWGPTSPAGAFLGARTGQTRARISPGGLVVRTGTEIMAAVGSPDAHMRLHDEGGTVTGRPFLRVPTANALTTAGADINAGHSVRGLPGYRVIRTSTGKLWIVRDAGGVRSGRIEFMYLLIRSATFRARGIFAATTAELQGIFARLFDQEIGLVLRRVS